MDPVPGSTAEHIRLEEDARRQQNWKRWGPYLAERQWGTVREDYSPDGAAWTSFPHDHARSRAYRWGEDGLLGITDRECRLCFALSLWNGKDPILKERLFGLVNSEGNHGEDVKEYYFYLDSTPTHSYMRALYKYPQAEYPYTRLVQVNQQRSRDEGEFELGDTGVFEGNRYFDVFAEYAKASPDDILIRITVVNRGPEPAVLHVLPTLWFRNTWSWGCTNEGCWTKPWIAHEGPGELATWHVTLGRCRLLVQAPPGKSEPQFLFTDNITNVRRLYGVEGSSRHVKDAFHEYLIHGRFDAVNPQATGTKAAALYRLELAAGEQQTIRLRLFANPARPEDALGREFDRIFDLRIREAREFYQSCIPPALTPEQAGVAHQAYASLLWSKQFYHYSVREWLEGDPDQPPPPPQRKNGRNADWGHLYNRDVISMPDKWEYPWYAAWDLAFHMIPFARIDPHFAKDQLVLLLREWYMHPNGQIPAYEFALGDVNPPVHAWSAWRVYKMTGPRGGRDRLFLERVFQKLLLNFTWWVNRKDVHGKHIFAGGFLGLDNIGVFDRSHPLPTCGYLEQADGTAWMAFYCATMLSMALELARENPAYEDIASKFFEHFVAICDAINTLGGTGLWDEEDGFYYDQLRTDHGNIRLRVRSLVGLIPLLAVEILEDEAIEQMPAFRKRMRWFLENRKDLARQVAYMEPGSSDGYGYHLLAIPCRDRLERVLRYMLSEDEFLSPYGIRSLSRVHADHPYIFRADGSEYCVEYMPGESRTSVFGGNSNWRGPIWIPINYLLIEAMERYHHFYGDGLRVEFPTGSGRWVNLQQVARELSCRLARMFLRDESGCRPINGGDARFDQDPAFRDMVLFYEHFHGDSGRGLGASHQTGWTAVITRCFEELARGITDGAEQRRGVRCIADSSPEAAR